MVLIAAAVCNKSGKALVSRQFVEMTRARIEGLLAAFPKLMNTGKQHTFMETESVRYVYQSLEKLYIVLITTKASNILEDLETLRLFAKVVPEYGKSLEESDIVQNSFQLIFAFDEIVALGYRESVNLAQIHTFIQMDSHEEKVAIAVRETQEKEAAAAMKRKQKDLDRARKDAQRRGVNPYSGGISGGSISNNGVSSSPVLETSTFESKPAASTAPKRPVGKGMKLGSKNKDVNNFVDQLQQEGVEVQDVTPSGRSAAIIKASLPDISKESVHLKMEEKITCIAGRDGGLQNLEVLGSLHLFITDSSYDSITVAVNNKNTKGCQMQTHPHIDKKIFQTDSILAPKNQGKPFPLKQEVGVLKWRLQTTDETQIPLTINCWPNVSSSGCDVNIEYELQDLSLELRDVVITIPVPSGVGAPKVSECEGDYRHDSRKNILEWSLPVIDHSNPNGTLEFSIAGHEDDFFPVSLSFVSSKSYCGISVTEVKTVNGNKPVKFSSEVVFLPEKYEVV